MKEVKLTKTVQLLDEMHEGKGPAPTATNYAGQIVRVSDTYAAELIAAGKAEPCVREPAGETAEAVAATTSGGEETL